MSPLRDDETSFSQFGERTPLPSTALSDFMVLDLLPGSDLGQPVYVNLQIGAPM